MMLSLKSMFVLGLLSVLLGAMVVYGLKTTTLMDDTDEGAIIVETIKFPLKLRMMLNKTAFELNETVGIEFSAENIGNETLNMSLYEDDFNFVIYDEASSEVYDWNKNWAHPAIYIPMPLPPGLSRSGAFQWSQDYNPILVSLDQYPYFEYKKVSPGRYQIVGQFTSGHLRLIVETPPVTITIRS